MKIRDSLSKINGDKTEYEMPSGGLEIISEDGRTLFYVGLVGLDEIEISGGTVCRNEGFLLDDKLQIIPKTSNRVHIVRPRYND